MFEVRQLAVGGFDQNFSYIIHDTATRECIVVDPCGDTELIRAELVKKDYNFILKVSSLWISAKSLFQIT